MGLQTLVGEQSLSHAIMFHFYYSIICNKVQLF